MWQRGAEAIQAVSADIYVFKTGRIANLPPVKSGSFAKTVRDECEMLIRGVKPLFPPARTVRRRGGGGGAGQAPLDPAAGDVVMLEGGIAREDRDVTPPTDDGDGGYRHPYLNSMRYRGGGYALLLAFFHHPRPNRSHHYKSELIRDAQRYCDDAMEPDYFAGRTVTAGWKSIDSLVRHRLVERLSHNQARARNGFARGGPRDEFTLTEEGRRFVEAMMLKWPDAASPGHGDGGGCRAAAGPAGVGFPVMSSAGFPSQATGGGTPIRPVAPSRPAAKDEEELLTFLRSAQKPGQKRTFDVSHARRTHLHHLCEYLIWTGEYSLNHESRGKGSNRKLVVTFEGKRGLAASARGITNLASGYDDSDEEKHIPITPFDVLSSAVDFATPLRSAKRSHDDMISNSSMTTSGMGRKLGSGHSDGASFRNTDPRTAAFRAAEKRLRTCEVKREEDDMEMAIAASLKETTRAAVVGKRGKQTKKGGFDTPEVYTSRSSQDDETDDDMKKAIAASLEDARASNKKRLRAQSSSGVQRSLEFSTSAYGNSPRLPITAEGSPLSIVQEAVEVLHSDESSIGEHDEHNNLCLIIDSRERVSNAHPRQLMDGLRTHLSGLAEAIHNKDMRATIDTCTVERKSLSTSDFAWVLPNGHMAHCLVERKKVSDLVGRSAEPGGIAHMEQIHRIRRIGRRRSSSANTNRGYLLIEGSLSQASRSIVYDERNEDGPRVDSREAIYDLVARLFVTDSWSSMQLIHTLDHEGTCRHLALMTTIVAHMKRSMEPHVDLKEFNRRYGKGHDDGAKQDFNDRMFVGLVRRGEGRDDARRVADAVTERFFDGEELAQEYGRCTSERARELLLGPLFCRHVDSCANVSKEVRARWSRNVHKAFQSIEDVDEMDDRPALEVSNAKSCAIELGSRQLHISGPLSSDLPSDAVDDESFVVVENGLESTGGVRDGRFRWVDLHVTDGPCRSRTFRVVVVTGAELVDYVKSVFEESSSDWDVASTVVRLLHEDLNVAATADDSGGGGGGDADEYARRMMIVFEGVLTECRRYSRGARSGDLPPNLQQRLRVLCELAVNILHHGDDDGDAVRRHVLSIQESSASKQVLRALVAVLLNEAFLYFGPNQCQVARLSEPATKGSTSRNYAQPRNLRNQRLSNADVGERGSEVQKANRNDDVIDLSEPSQEESGVDGNVEDVIDLLERPEEGIPVQESSPDEIDLLEDSQDSVVVL